VSRQARLWLALYLPRLPVEIWQRSVGADARAPLDAVVDGPANTPRIAALTQSAQAQGLHNGMLLSAALVMQPQLEVRQRGLSDEHEALMSLAGWSSQFTSMVSPVSGAHTGLLLELGASQRLFGDAGKLAIRIVEELVELGYSAVWALAPTPTAAWLLARAQRCLQLYALPQLREALGPVPLHCLELDLRSIESLASVGIRHLADCWDLPRAETARRFGPALWQQLDRALGKRADPRRTYQPPDRVRHVLNLLVPVQDVEPLLFAFSRLVGQMQGVLLAGNAAAQVLDLELGLAGGKRIHLAIELIAPSRDGKHLRALLRHRLEQVHLEQPVEQIALEASQTVNLAPRNLDLFDDTLEREDEWAATLERLRARLGRECVHAFELMPEQRPESAWRPVPPLVERESIAAAPVSPLGDIGIYRPLWLLAKPRSLELRAGVPCYGGSLQLETPAERIESGWWEGRDVRRDYHVASNAQGERYWIFQDRRNRGWYLHGVFS
jgi:protein ImuB